MRNPRLGTIALAASVFSLSSAFATPARAGDAAAAQALFDDGKRLMAQHDYVQACAKFDESQRQDPGMGTLFHLADCEEQIGKTASAWAAFLEVADDAKVHGESDRATAAASRAAALEPKLARLTIDPGAERATPGLQLVRDSEAVGAGQWATAMPVDPGPHVIQARAPGKGAWSTTVNVAPGARAVVTVPLLADAPAPMSESARAALTTPTSADMPSDSPGSGQRAAGLVIGGAGIVGLGVGAYFAAASLARHNDAQSHCTGNVCDATGVSYRDDARKDGNAATIALSIGGAALVGGLITYLTAPRSSGVRTAIAVGPGSVLVGGSW